MNTVWLESQVGKSDDVDGALQGFIDALQALVLILPFVAESAADDKQDLVAHAARRAMESAANLRMRLLVLREAARS